jgi:hypothetical protein
MLVGRQDGYRPKYQTGVNAAKIAAVCTGKTRLLGRPPERSDRNERGLCRDEELEEMLGHSGEAPAKNGK